VGESIDRNKGKGIFPSTESLFKRGPTVARSNANAMHGVWSKSVWQGPRSAYGNDTLALTSLVYAHHQADLAVSTSQQMLQLENPIRQLSRLCRQQEGPRQGCAILGVDLASDCLSDVIQLLNTTRPFHLCIDNPLRSATSTLDANHRPHPNCQWKWSTPRNEFFHN
jgi:hypothetical protein